MTESASRRLPVAVLAGLLPWLVLLAWGLSTLRVTTDMSQFLPQGASAEQVMLMEELRAGHASRTLLIGLQGAPQQVLAAASDYLHSQLTPGDDFEAVYNGRRSVDPADHSLLYRYRYLLINTTPDYWSAPTLQVALQRQLDIMMSSMVQGLAGDPAADPVSAWPAWLRSLQPGKGPQLRHGVWFSANGERALLLARTRAPAFAIADQQSLLEKLRASFAGHADFGAINMQVSGPALFAVQSRDIISREATLLSLGGTLLVILLLWRVLRRLSMVVLAAVPLLAGILTAVAVVSLVFGGIHGITLAFGITVIGVAVDYPLHLFMHKRSAESGTVTMARIWPVLRLGLLTTATGYLAMLFSGFSGLAQLGLFAVSGLAAAVLFSRYVLPPLVNTDWQAPELPVPTGLAVRGMRPALWLLSVSGLLIMGLAEDPWQQDIAALSPALEEQKALDSALRGELGAADTRHFILISGEDAEQVLQTAETVRPRLDQLVSEAVIDSYDIISRYVPSTKTQTRRRAALPEPELLRRNLQQAAQGLPFRPGSFAAFVQAVEDSLTLPPLRLENLDNTLVADMVQGLMFSRAGQWHALVPLTGIHDYRALQVALTGEDVVVLDLKAESAAMLAAYRQRTLAWLALGAVIIVLVLALGLRSLPAALRVFLPVLAALAVTVAILILAGERLSLFHLASLLLVAGIALDYGLFYQAPEADAARRRRSLQAIMLCAVTTILVFGLLALARTPVLHAIGLTVVTGTLAALVYTLFSIGPARPKKP